MHHRHPVRRFGAVIAALLFSLPAFAVWDGQVVVSGTSLQDIKQSTLTFTTGGQTVPVTVEGEDDDGNVILGIGFTGDSATSGTLSISGPGGSKTIATPAAAAGQDIFVDTTGPGSASLSRPPRSRPAGLDIYFPKHSLKLSAGWLNLEGGDIATAGTILPSGPGSEYPSLRADYDVDTTGGSLSYAYNLERGLPSWIDRKGLSSNLTLGFEYGTWYDDENDGFSEPSGGSGTGFLISALAPAPGDSTGAFFGPYGIQSIANVDVEYDRFGVFTEWLCDRELPDDAFLVSRLSFNYAKWDVDVETRDTFEPTFPSSLYYDSRVQSVEQDLYDLGFGTTVINPLNKLRDVDMFLGVMAHLYYNDADLDSLERFRTGTSPESTRTVRESDEELRLGLDFNAGIGWNISRNLRATAEFGVMLNTPSATIDNPVRGDGSNPGPGDLPLTNIDFDGETLWKAQLGIRYTF